MPVLIVNENLPSASAELPPEAQNNPDTSGSWGVMSVSALTNYMYKELELVPEH